VRLDGSGIARLAPPVPTAPATPLPEPPPAEPPVPAAPAANPAASLTPERFLYGALEIESQRGRTFTLKNTGNVDLANVQFRLQGEHLDEFSLSSPTCGTLAVGKECKTDVTFVPHEEGSHSMRLLAFSTARELNRATLSGVGKPKPGPIAQISPNPLELGEKNREGKVTITNTGQAALTIAGISLDDSKNFELKAKECMAASPLERGQSCTIAVKFKGKRTAQGLISLSHNDPTASSKVMLAADVSPSNKKKWATGLLVAGAITAAVAVAATSGDKPNQNTTSAVPRNTGDSNTGVTPPNPNVDSPSRSVTGTPSQLH